MISILFTLVDMFIFLYLLSIKCSLVLRDLCFRLEIEAFLGRFKAKVHILKVIRSYLLFVILFMSFSLTFASFCLKIFPSAIFLSYVELYLPTFFHFYLHLLPKLHHCPLSLYSSLSLLHSSSSS